MRAERDAYDREILARLTPKTTNFMRMASSTVRAENLAYLLTGLRRGPMYLAEWRDLGNENARRFLWAELHNVLPRMPSVKVWNNNFLILDKLIQLSLVEISANNLCQTCKGIKQIKVGELIKTCQACLGLGSRGMAGHDRARFLGVPETTWRRHWRHKYADVYRVVLVYDTMITANVRKRLKTLTLNGV